MGRDEDIETLRARLATLERERLELAARTNAAIAAAQDRAYWLERWELDLDRALRRPGGRRLRAATRALRGVRRVAARSERGSGR